MADERPAAGADALVSSLRQKAREAGQTPEATAAAADEHLARTRRTPAEQRRAAALAILFGVAALWAGWRLTVSQTQATAVGRVVDLYGRGVEGAVVEVEGTSLRAESDEHGDFTLCGIWPGNHWLLVQLPGVSGTATPYSFAVGGTTRVRTVRLYRP